MSNWKEKISLRNCSSANIAALCWAGTILAGNIAVLACNKVNFKTFPGNCAASAVLFLIQLATAIILGECYNKTRSAIHRKILIALGVLHGILMLGDMLLLLSLNDISLWSCFILSIVLFFGHGNLFDAIAEEVARYCCCLIQFDCVDTTRLLFCSSAVRDKNEIKNENYYLMRYCIVLNNCGTGLVMVNRLL